MRDATRKSGRPWTLLEIQLLIALARKNTRTAMIAARLGRSAAAIRSKASQEGLRLRPGARDSLGIPFPGREEGRRGGP